MPKEYYMVIAEDDTKLCSFLKEFLTERLFLKYFGQTIERVELSHPLYLTFVKQYFTYLL